MTKINRQKKRGNKAIKTIRKLTSYKKECWFWLSLYVRLYWSDDKGYVECITTKQKRFYYKDNIDAGHFIPKSKGKFATYSFSNIFPQSKGSNMSPSGDQYIMGIEINKLNALGRTKYSADELLRIQATSSIKNNKKYLISKINEYKVLVLKLSKEKGLYQWEVNCPKMYLK